MTTTLQPVVSDIADLFWWKATATIASNVATSNANLATSQVKLLPNAFFCFVAWRGVTNYDPCVQLRASIGAGPAAATGLYPAAVPSNFEAMVRRNNRFMMMDQPMPQAALCSTGYRAGNQVPYPILYPPATTFNFELYNTAETLFLNADGSAKDMRIDFGLFGYNVLSTNLSIFLNSWPELYGLALDQLTGISPRLNA